VEEQIIEKEIPRKKHHLRISWWLIVLAIVVFGAAAYLASAAITAKIPTTATGLHKIKPDTSNEIKIQQTLSSIRGNIITYYEAKKTYVGWAPDQTQANNVKRFGSEIQTKLSANNYMIYALMPSSKLTFCMDNKFTGQVNKITVFQKACQ
jgi:hypothetical protein